MKKTKLNDKWEENLNHKLQDECQYHLYNLPEIVLVLSTDYKTYDTMVNVVIRFIVQKSFNAKRSKN